MAIKTFDIASANGLNDLKKELEGLEKKLERTLDPIKERLANDFVREVVMSSNTIYTAHVRHSVSNGNEIIKDAGLVKIRNLTEHATYSEFGTGPVGENSPKHPMKNLVWEHNVKNREPGQGWNYFHNGEYWHSKGFGANPIYFTSFENMIQKLPETARIEVEKMLSE